MQLQLPTVRELVFTELVFCHMPRRSSAQTPLTASQVGGCSTAPGESCLGGSTGGWKGTFLTIFLQFPVECSPKIESLCCTLIF